MRSLREPPEFVGGTPPRGNSLLTRQHIVGATLLTLLWGAVLFFILYLWHSTPRDGQDFAHYGPFAVLFRDYSGWWYIDLPIALLYTFVHPVIGKVFAVVVERFCSGLDYVFDLDRDERWGGWSKEKQLYFAVFWPITGPVTLLLTAIGLVYGLLFKSMFKG
jgi:hypothetical protein